MGIKHGGWCVGCCWALMAALFALGVMSIGWMAFIAALIAIEKLLPWRVIASRGVAVVLLVLGLSVALLPHDVPDVRSPAPICKWRSPDPEIYKSRRPEVLGLVERSITFRNAHSAHGHIIDNCALDNCHHARRPLVTRCR